SGPCCLITAGRFTATSRRARLRSQHSLRAGGGNSRALLWGQPTLRGGFWRSAPRLPRSPQDFPLNLVFVQVQAPWRTTPRQPAHEPVWIFSHVFPGDVVDAILNILETSVRLLDQALLQQFKEPAEPSPVRCPNPEAVVIPIQRVTQ